MNVTLKESKDAWSLLNCLVKSVKLANKKFTDMKEADIRPLGLRNDIQMFNLHNWCKLLNMSYERVDWDGNESCESDWDKIFFIYKGVEFFELVAKFESAED